MLRRASILLQQHRLAGSAFILAVTQFAASVAGLLRDRILFQTFPGLGITDVYFASFRPSDFLFQACIMSALGTVLVPVLAGHRAHDRSGEVEKVLSGTMMLGAFAFGGIALILAILFPWIAPHLVQFSGEQLTQYVQFARLALLSNFLFVFGSTLGQQLIASQRFWMYGITPVLYTCGTILGTWLLTPHFGVYGPMVGTVLGALVYTILRAIAVYRSGIRFRFTLWHPDFSGMGALMLPRVLSLGALQLQLLVFDGIGSGLPTGSISVNLASRNFQSVVVGVVGIALAQAVYSPLSQAAARKDIAAYGRYLRLALQYAIALTVPGAIILVLCAPIAAAVVDLGSVYGIFRWTLLLYALSIPFESINHLLLRGYYALKDTLLPALCTIAGGAAAILIAWIVAPKLGVYALGLAFVTGQCVQAAGLGVFLPGRLRRLRETRE